MDIIFLLCIIILICILLVFVRLYAAGGVNHSHRDLAHKVIVVTGGTHGLGRVLVEELSSSGAQIISMSRNDSLSDAVLQEIKSIHKDANLSHIHLDLNDLVSVKSAAIELSNKVDHIDFLVNNAGILNAPFEKTKQGYEATMGVNYLGHFLLTNLVLPMIEKCNGRVINYSSVMSLHYNQTDFPFKNDDKKFSPMKCYCESKLAMAMFAKQLSIKNNKITAASLHPGGVNTSLFRYYPKILMAIINLLLRIVFKSPLEGVQTALHLIHEENVTNGAYYADCKVSKRRNKFLEDKKLLEKLWEDSIMAVQDFLN
ncbi:restnol dehydrogenase, putative [Entamoeba invadens IP1]|uniref:Restnol dehydrogenase, putative n=1 Tax=Entamoeba invadens IP1 TaxID=370355 RepID=A0A0A1U4C1_ENTIV|nr:restnol dehydrogenase, putative [Entamoeba invadens IP1]ELP87695.1 restnol dehydrogenase, putative [Entamoeba invadens IP1]|eukprot:XP_004254466.1 restnol dehydrogenase, putative [Entamoeba invadens IP1]